MTRTGVARRDYEQVRLSGVVVVPRQREDGDVSGPPGRQRRVLVLLRHVLDPRSEDDGRVIDVQHLPNTINIRLRQVRRRQRLSTSGMEGRKAPWTEVYECAVALSSP